MFNKFIPKIISLLLIVASVSITKAQNQNFNSLFNILEDVVINVDTLSFSYNQNTVIYRTFPHLAFQYFDDEQVIEIELHPNNKRFFDGKNVNVLRSSEYDILDSLVWLDDSYFKMRVRFKGLAKSDFVNFIFTVESANRKNNYEIKLFPFTNTKATVYTGEEDLYIGEEKKYEIITNNAANLLLDGVWKKHGSFEYRLIEHIGKPYLSIIPNELGKHQFDISFPTKKPFVDHQKNIKYQIENQSFNFNVRGSRLSFLRIENREVIVSEDNREGIEIQIDNNRLLQINKTYRIEDREEKGGPLVAEIFTLRRLSNDKVLCVIRPYLYHRNSEGYLYMKDGDVAMFVTNINIVPEAKIEKISILRRGKDYSSERKIFPGETFEIKVEGVGLNNANLIFEDLYDISGDSLIRNDKTQIYKLRVPNNINKRKVAIFNGEKAMGIELNIEEYQKPRELDFVKIDYGAGLQNFNQLENTILYDHAVRDIMFSFDPNRIDMAEEFFGKQFLEIEIRITGPKDELVEFQKIENIEVCPGENSIRSAFYQNGNCNRQDISLNSILSRKTHTLDDWAKIEILVKHKKDKYSQEGFNKKVVIVLQKLITFDIDVSFPAGLIIKKVGVDGFPGLGGISLAMLAQFSFYDSEKIRQLKPYKIGAGFLAQNALNFNPEVQDRDLGIVVIGSIYPLKSNKKLSFPLFAGFGYFLNQSKLFYLIGPGISVAF